jgi:isocitrate/isopropylmalate dehydrogenase
MMKLLSDGNAMLTYELGLIPSALMGQRMIVTA